MQNTLKERLEWAMREASDVSQADLARACGIKQPSVNDWISGKTKTIKGANLLNASRLLGVRPEWLASGMGHPRTSVSRYEATTLDALHSGVRRVRIEGAVVMEENGFWSVGDIEAEEAAYPTDDPEAYAIRVTSQRFKPVVSLAQCILVSPRSPVKPGRPVVVTTTDGRKTLRTFVSRESGVLNLASVNDANDYLDLSDSEVSKVERVMAYLWTD